MWNTARRLVERALSKMNVPTNMTVGLVQPMPNKDFAQRKNGCWNTARSLVECALSQKHATKIPIALPKSFARLGLLARITKSQECARKLNVICVRVGRSA